MLSIYYIILYASLALGLQIPLHIPTTEGWVDPRTNGGQFLDFTTQTKGEPLNVIISAHSDPFILTDWGIHHYAK